MYDEACYRLPFDIFSRHALVAEAIRSLRQSRPANADLPALVLDVGGAAGAVGLFLPEFQVVTVDPAIGVEESDETDPDEKGKGPRNLIRAVGTRLPFEDDAFPWVTCIDTLEHLPSEARRGLLEEICRVGSGFALLTFPFASEANRRGEDAVRELRDSPVVDRFLAEHREHGLPEPAAVRSLVRELGYSCRLRFGTPRSPVLFNHALEELCALVPGGERELVLLQGLLNPGIPTTTETEQAYRVLLEIPLGAKSVGSGKPGKEDRPEEAAVPSAFEDREPVLMGELAREFRASRKTLDEAAAHTRVLEEQLRSSKEAYSELERHAGEQSRLLEEKEGAYRELDGAYRELDARRVSTEKHLAEVEGYCRDLESELQRCRDEIAAFREHPLRYVWEKRVRRAGKRAPSSEES